MNSRESELIFEAYMNIVENVSSVDAFKYLKAAATSELMSVTELDKQIKDMRNDVGDPVIWNKVVQKIDREAEGEKNRTRKTSPKISAGWAKLLAALRDHREQEEEEDDEPALDKLRKAGMYDPGYDDEEDGDQSIEEPRITTGDAVVSDDDSESFKIKAERINDRLWRDKHLTGVHSGILDLKKHHSQMFIDHLMLSAFSSSFTPVDHEGNPTADAENLQLKYTGSLPGASELKKPPAELYATIRLTDEGQLNIQLEIEFTGEVWNRDEADLEQMRRSQELVERQLEPSSTELTDQITSGVTLVKNINRLAK